MIYMKLILLGLLIDESNLRGEAKTNNNLRCWRYCKGLFIILFCFVFDEFIEIAFKLMFDRLESFLIWIL